MPGSPGVVAPGASPPTHTLVIGSVGWWGGGRNEGWLTRCSSSNGDVYKQESNKLAWRSGEGRATFLLWLGGKAVQFFSLWILQNDGWRGGATNEGLCLILGVSLGCFYSKRASPGDGSLCWVPGMMAIEAWTMMSPRDCKPRVMSYSPRRCCCLNPGLQGPGCCWQQGAPSGCSPFPLLRSPGRGTGFVGGPWEAWEAGGACSGGGHGAGLRRRSVLP